MTVELQKLLVPMAKRHAWDPCAIYAVISLETGGSFDPMSGLLHWKPNRTATGLLQWTEGTAKSLGVEPTGEPPLLRLGQYRGTWASWAIGKMSLPEQVELVETFFQKSFERRSPKRASDYYLATWGAMLGLSEDHVLAVSGDSKYELNRSLDHNQDGKIQVSDLTALVRHRMKECPVIARDEAIPFTLTDVLVSLGFAFMRARMGRW